jgi:hypothetical protein
MLLAEEGMEEYLQQLEKWSKAKFGLLI